MHTTDISAAFPFLSKYSEVLGVNMHYVDEGQGDPILFVTAIPPHPTCGVTLSPI